MARQLQRLSARKVETAKAGGYYCDGGGLYLQVSNSGAKSWIFRYTLEGKSREMGLGPLHDVTLADARLSASEARILLRQKLDPIKVRDSDGASRALDAAKTITFAQCAASYIKSHKVGWRSIRHADQWTETLETNAYPVFGHLPVQEIDTGLVIKVLEPMWTTKTVTATRLRGRIEAIIDWAKARGYRMGENPARWRGHLENLLPALLKRRKVEHYTALPFDQMGKFISELRTRDETIVARALEFLILTVARTGEVIGATFHEFDLENAIWTVPASRMKAGNEHRVPLTERAVAIVREMKEKKTGEYVFPGRGIGKPISSMTMLKLLGRMGYKVTTHGFRSAFRDWASVRTSYPREVCEMALAHTVSDAVEAAYRRGDLLDKRRKLMDEWARHCQESKKAGKVTPIRKAAK